MGGFLRVGLSDALFKYPYDRETLSFTAGTRTPLPRAADADEPTV
jgi:hypothetical protein